MNPSRRLRLRLLGALVSSGFVAAWTPGCGGTVVTGHGTGGASGSGGSAGTGGAGGSAGSGGSAGASGAAGAPACTYGTPGKECSAYQGPCPPFTGITNGCCNPAISGPTIENGQCCYLFCEGACCGRPFVVDGVPVVAAPAERADWHGDIADAAPDSALADAWLRDALMEHASIASFARFTLDLLALGAPAELVADAQRAALDEVEHARLCFALAARHGGAELGPGPLPVAFAPRASLAEAAVAATLEGCIGETTAALVAARQLAVARDAATRAALARIAGDEARHAELAWRFVAWAVATGGGAVRDAVTRAFAMRMPDDAPAAAPANHAFGRLGPEELRDAARDARRDVIDPCAAALLRTERVASPAGFRAGPTTGRD